MSRAWRRFIHPKHRDEDLARDISSYLAHEMDENLARGMSPEDARAAAVRKFGNTMAVREVVYAMNSLRLVESVWQGVRHGICQLLSITGLSWVTPGSSEARSRRIALRAWIR
ncbi:MAG: permease prefix domain 1-containing protein [Bryobacteraceae bacterium]